MGRIESSSSAGVAGLSSDLPKRGTVNATCGDVVDLEDDPEPAIYGFDSDKVFIARTSNKSKAMCIAVFIVPR